MPNWIALWVEFMWLLLRIGPLMPRYRSKPAEIEAIMWTGHNIDEILKFVWQDNRWKELVRLGSGIKHDADKGTIWVPTMNGYTVAKAGDFLVRGVIGDLYPCKPGVFELKYEMI